MNTADSPYPGSSRLPHQVLEEAAQWYALLQSGEATATDRTQWQAWLDDAREHRIAWNYVDRISGRFGPIQASPERDSAVNGFRSAARHMARRRQVVLGLVGTLAASGLLGWAQWRHVLLPESVLAWAADYHTATGELRDIQLADGSQVWLNTASAFDQDYNGDLRRLRLVAGEILVRTAADPSRRPFVVDTPQGRLRALGTRFTVRLDGDRTFLAVYHGAVEIRTADTATTRIIQSGQQTRFTSQAVADVEVADPAREAWTHGILITDNTPLSEVARELQRYRGGHLGVAPEIANIPVVGSYSITDPDRTLATLETVLPIRVKRILPWWVTIEPRDGASSGH